MENIRITDFNYTLPDSKIAKEPAQPRDEAKLMVAGLDGSLIHTDFKHITNYLPDNSLLIFNDTKVVHARLYFQRKSGGTIEVFCLSPLLPHTELSQAMLVKNTCTWLCMAGNSKRWLENERLDIANYEDFKCSATLIKKIGKEAEIQFDWEGDYTFSQVLSILGQMPLPPYLDRLTNEADEIDYQSIFAENEGAVAAPTASLHFTTDLMEYITSAGHDYACTTLHVSAGTFNPVTELDDVTKHNMHSEQLVFTTQFLKKLTQHHGKIVPVGTTSMRAIESLLYLALLVDSSDQTITSLLPFCISKDKGYAPIMLPEHKRHYVLYNLLSKMESEGLTEIKGSTEIMIIPGYNFPMCDALITNFHQPNSTLLMLVSAFSGTDNIKHIYETALNTEYRFLSYGDGMLLLRE
ncbi:MAG: S-adenosylmethionine:tRNA ribosyltransferase-isomerase [Bacteroidota bacterium]|nr:S-adenosylmethionine:tRNA ribosyltransferase-isomerase [Bacteroidota bacterium]